VIEFEGTGEVPADVEIVVADAEPGNAWGDQWL
jgi:hypothetical protein